MARRMLATRRRKIIAVAAVALLVVGAAAGAAMSALEDYVDAQPDPVRPGPAAVPPGLTVEADAVQYAGGDIVSVSGGAAAPGGVVTLSITNFGGELVWQEAVRARADRSYSTLTIAGGPGWESPGLYVLDASDGVDRVTFGFDFAP